MQVFLFWKCKDTIFLPFMEQDLLEAFIFVNLPVAFNHHVRYSCIIGCVPAERPTLTNLTNHAICPP